MVCDEFVASLPPLKQGKDHAGPGGDPPAGCGWETGDGKTPYQA